MLQELLLLLWVNTLRHLLLAHHLLRRHLSWDGGSVRVRRSRSLHIRFSLEVLLLSVEVSLLLQFRLDQSNELVQDSIDFRSAHHLSNISVCLLKVLEISLIMHFFILLLSNFLNLVVVDEYLLSVEILKMGLSLGS